MKKITFFTTVGVFMASLVYAQVGINTQNPQTTFHIDGAKDNQITGTPTVTQQANDVSITATGRIGIGTIAPSQKLDIQTGGTIAAPVPGIRIADGNQTDNFALVSDANGVGTWKPISVDYQIIDPLGVGNYILPANTATGNYTGVQISLPPGKWILNLVIPIRVAPNYTYMPGSQFPRLRLMDSNAGPIDVTTPSPYSADAIRPKLVSATISNSQDLGFMVGSLGINNTSTGTKTYYLYADNYFSVGDTNGDGSVAGDWLRKETQFMLDDWNEASISYIRIKQ
ncbi:hypothetical protein [Chryseobacterium sp. MEBOG07]|uniref:hypothetical protein n=1 Tax=Chryseobacterium sp. MEBOG07 TaxID=2879939 RepID=UPI001F445974|nr:hypothetical protein [Chryseobacterium sp. MEBOG07]UKB78323.1 hypothetical protein LF886_17830 [Chryseobacterium sp. MEBOG07]